MAKPFPALVRYSLQCAAYAAFAAVIGYFSTAPPYRQRGEHEAVLKLSFSHLGQLRFACRTRDAAELAKLQPNMRSTMDCPRERAQVRVELDMDGRALYRVSTDPMGLQKDGAATVYRRLNIPAGTHHFSAGMADAADGLIHYRNELTVDLQAGQVIVVDFLTGSGGFVFTRG